MHDCNSMELTLRSSFLHSLDVKLTASSGRGHRGSPKHNTLGLVTVFYAHNTSVDKIFTLTCVTGSLSCLVVVRLLWYYPLIAYLLWVCDSGGRLCHRLRHAYCVNQSRPQTLIWVGSSLGTRLAQAVPK